MAVVEPTEARFPAVPAGAGHYESFYLKLCHPKEPLGAWIRYTVHKRPSAPANGSLWFTLFQPGGPRAEKVTLPEPATGEGDWIRIGKSRMGDGEAVGSAGARVSWQLRFESEEDPLLHLPREWMYRARLPRTKLLSPAPAARFDGRLTMDGHDIAVDAWRGMVGHNWGAQHAERWIWLHGLAAGGDWLDVALGKLKLGPLTTPWVANGAVTLGGERHALGGPGRRARVSEEPDRCEFQLSGKDLVVRGRVFAAPENFVGWVYADPDGSEHHTVNCSIADLRLEVKRGRHSPVRIEVVGGATYELGMRERDHGMEIQPHPDG